MKPSTQQFTSQNYREMQHTIHRETVKIECDNAKSTTNSAEEERVKIINNPKQQMAYLRYGKMIHTIKNIMNVE
jgi:hypothetical protein